MKVTVTLQDILDKGAWDRYCDMRGWDVYIINEGKASPDEEVTLTTEQAVELGFLKQTTFMAYERTSPQNKGWSLT